MSVTVKAPKYALIYEQLKARIRTGQLGLGDQLPPEQSLAEEFGVSRLTVRQAIGMLAAERVVESIQGKGSFVAAPEGHPRTAMKTIHWVTASFHDKPGQAEDDALLAQMVMALSRQMTRQGGSLSISMLNRGETFADFIAARGIPESFRHGVVISNVVFTREDAALLERERVPYVLLPAFDLDFEAPVVGTDDESGILQCMEFLIKYGHRKIALFTCQPDYHPFPFVLSAYRRALENVGVAFDPLLVVSTTPWDEQEGAGSMRKLREREAPFTAVLTFGDQATIGAARFLQEEGVRVPEDLSLAVYDRYAWMDSVFPYKFAGVAQNVLRQSEAIMALLTEQRETGQPVRRRVMIPPVLYPGSSAQYLFAKGV